LIDSLYGLQALAKPRLSLVDINELYFGAGQILVRG
jgi:hypothetical protein